MYTETKCPDFFEAKSFLIFDHASSVAGISERAGDTDPVQKRSHLSNLHGFPGLPAQPGVSVRFLITLFKI